MPERLQPIFVVLLLLWVQNHACANVDSATDIIVTDSTQADSGVESDSEDFGVALAKLTMAQEESEPNEFQVVEDFHRAEPQHNDERVTPAHPATFVARRRPPTRRSRGRISNSSNVAPRLPGGRRYYNGRYFGNFNNRFYGPQYGYF